MADFVGEAEVMLENVDTPLRSVRAFNVDRYGRLTSPMVHMVWKPGVNTSSKTRSGDGFYSYYRRMHAGLYHEMDGMYGVVKNTGLIDIGTKGMTSEHAEIVALTRHPAINRSPFVARNWVTYIPYIWLFSMVMLFVHPTDWSDQTATNFDILLQVITVFSSIFVVGHVGVALLAHAVDDDISLYGEADWRSGHHYTYWETFRSFYGFAPADAQARYRNTLRIYPDAKVYRNSWWMCWRQRVSRRSINKALPRKVKIKSKERRDALPTPDVDPKFWTRN